MVDIWTKNNTFPKPCLDRLRAKIAEPRQVQAGPSTTPPGSPPGSPGYMSAVYDREGNANGAGPSIAGQGKLHLSLLRLIMSRLVSSSLCFRLGSKRSDRLTSYLLVPRPHATDLDSPFDLRRCRRACRRRNQVACIPCPGIDKLSLDIIHRTGRKAWPFWP